MKRVSGTSKLLSGKDLIILTAAVAFLVTSAVIAPNEYHLYDD